MAKRFQDAVSKMSNETREALSIGLRIGRDALLEGFGELEPE